VPECFGGRERGGKGGGRQGLTTEAQPEVARGGEKKAYIVRRLPIVLFRERKERASCYSIFLITKERGRGKKVLTSNSLSRCIEREEGGKVIPIYIFMPERGKKKKIWDSELDTPDDGFLKKERQLVAEGIEENRSFPSFPSVVVGRKKKRPTSILAGSGGGGEPPSPWKKVSL